MSKKSDLQKELERLNQSKAKIEAELSRLAEKETGHLNAIGEDIIAGNDGQSMQALADVRLRKDALTHSLNLVNTKIEPVETDLRNLGYVERQVQWSTVEASLRQEFEQAQNTVAAAKAAMDKVLEHAQQAKPLVVSQDGTIRITKYENVWVEASRSLYQTWAHMETIRLNEPGAAKRPESSNNIISGFGRLP